MKTLTSKIATIVYANYTENVDMLNQHFKQSELDALVKNDSDIIRVDYYINGELVGNKTYTANQAISQIIKMRKTMSEICNKIERVDTCGDKWKTGQDKIDTLNRKMSELESKESFYMKFINEKEFNDSELPCIMCCDWTDFN